MVNAATQQLLYLHPFDTMGNNDDNNDNTGMENMTVAIPERGLTKVSINTTRNQARRAIYEHADAMEAAFGLHCQDFLDEFLLLVSFRYSPEVSGRPGFLS
mgnify:CR=1 FL=1